jgi:cytoplasmic iron level regulating protein YaaA (DUF328/UPF0246 family)
MLTVISPAKRLDAAPKALPEGIAATQPQFAADAAALVKIAAQLTPADLRRLMSISPALADLNATRFAAFDAQPCSPAALLFAGDTYAGLGAGQLEPDAWRWADLHLRILSGLYGLLRPTDLIAPYRLEMGSRLTNPRGADLYAWWGDKLARALNAAAEEAGARVLVNCASVEYFRAVDPDALKLRVITPIFLDGDEGQGKVISFWAKRARGAMARFVIENRLQDPADLRSFEVGGYRFQHDLSGEDRMVFARISQPATVSA